MHIRSRYESTRPLSQATSWDTLYLIEIKYMYNEAEPHMGFSTLDVIIPHEITALVSGQVCEIRHEAKELLMLDDTALLGTDHSPFAR